MKILITSGGTSEKIDEVRKITNTSSGRLGALIAEEFIKQTKETEITYICGSNALCPNFKEIEIINIESVSELKESITELLSRKKFDAVIHAMAVSDYTVRSVMSSDDLSTCANKDLKNIKHIKKLSSNIDNLVIFMEKTPKIIKLIKQLQPNTILVGFKLLVGADESTLVSIGHELLVKNKCDFVLANDLEKIHRDNHTGLLIKSDFSYVKLNTKQEIAKTITSNVSAKIIERGEN